MVVFHDLGGSPASVDPITPRRQQHHAAPPRQTAAGRAPATQSATDDPVTRVNPPIPPADATDAELWLTGYELRNAHLPLAGTPECPACQTNWECAPYREGLEMMRTATERPPSTPF